MIGSAPISFNTAAESPDWVRANMSCGYALRRRTSARPIAPLAPAIRILIALPQLALRQLEARPRQVSAASTQRIEAPVRANTVPQFDQFRLLRRHTEIHVDLSLTVIRTRP